MKYRNSSAIAPALLFITASAAQGGDSDAQFWITGGANAPITDSTSATVLASQRFRESRRGGDQIVLRGQVDTKLSPSIAIGGGVTYVGFDAGHEWRAHQQVAFTFAPAQLRTQIEERFLVDAPRPQLRLRERLLVNLPVGDDNHALLSAEFLYIARPENPSASPRVDSLRFAGLLVRNVTDNLQASAGYMLIYAPRRGAQDRISHIPQLAITYRF